ncbi:DUF2515 family protein [Aquabacterium parvum]|uniref:DUF2515 family protein n=1 Tax=Aquabacterium parvum TaxID=70584 RepID=UPI000718D0BD|nr:hypothetical protein [Aquabacterium parvum]
MTVVDAKTNEKEQSCVDAVCNCDTMWSLAQQFCVERLTVGTGEQKGRLIEDLEVRAKRIAATYARFYLELESGCNPAKKGRFYWMALGAFASKTVACSLALYRVQALRWVNTALGKGNIWLFCDISGWHWYYARNPASFQMCLESRNASTYVPEVKKVVARLPWSDEALPVINQLKVSSHVRAGFAKVVEYERQQDVQRKRAIQMQHLLDIANHEQGVILQPLIYDDPVFAASVWAQRAPVLNWFSPSVELLFTHACSSDANDLKSIPPAGTEIEMLASRMKWIERAAAQFHELMIKKASYMERELRTMAAWVDMPDD